VSGRCDFDGSELYQRDDDKPETVRKRIQIYLEQTSPLIDHYRNHGKLIEVDGMQSIDVVNLSMMKALKK
jgi:adenylate kinase